jgi:uncharacterized protein (DUF1778 family)
MKKPRNQAERRLDNAQLDRTVIRVDPKAYDEFVQRLASPLQPNERLKQTMRMKAPWE